MVFVVHRLIPALIAVAFLYGSIFIATRLVGRRMREVFRFGKPVEIAPGSGRVYLAVTTMGGVGAGVGYGLLGYPSPLFGSLRFGAILVAHVIAFYLLRHRGTDPSIDDNILRAKHKKYVWAIIAPFLVAASACAVAVGNMRPHA